MAKSTAAKKQNPMAQFEDGVCTLCHHDFDQHITSPGATTAGPFTCPATPPAKQVTVDEAVVSKGGKPSTDFEEQVRAASGEAEKADRLKVAAEHFDTRPAPPHRSLGVALTHLRPMPNNPRAELGDVAALVASIEANGFIGSLNVRATGEQAGDGEEIYEVWAGNRRLKAAKQAGLTEVPCDIYDLTPVQALELNLTEQINRADLTPLEEGTACRALMELSGYDVHQVAAKLGQSASWVTKRTALCGIAPELQKELAKGHLSLTVANALAALPTQQQQVKAFDALEARPDWEKRDDTAEDQVAWLRAKLCRPLADATWKLTDAELVPEAGACATCPHNSASNAMPGLFDNAKAKPTCAQTECFEDKLLASWLARTAKQKAAGAKVLSLGEGRKLFGNGNALPTSSRYVEASDKPPKDKQGRTWAELVADVPEEHRPVLHLAQDNAGKVRSLYVQDKVLEAVAVHLKARWAKSVVEEAQERTDPKKRAEREEAEKEKRLVADVREHVEDAVLNGVAAQLAAKFTLPAARLLAQRLGERAVLRFGEATGRKKFPKDWLEKGATFDELLALVWLDDALDELRGFEGYDERFLAIAKSHGFDVEQMTKAQLETAKAEAEK